LGGNGFGFGANQLDEPGKIVLDEAGNLYIADTGNNRIQKWVRGTSEGVTVAGGKGWGNGLNKLDQPFGITLDKIGNLYITELENHRVMRWKPYAEEGEVIAGGNGEGNAADQLAYPLGVAVDEDLNVYVADSYNHRIQLFTPGATAGITLLSAEDLGSPQEFNYFSGIKLGKNKQLYLSDYQKRRVLQFDLTTKAVQIVAGDHGDGGNTDQLAHPYQLDVNPLGDIIIADAKNNRIQKWMPPELQ
jgi:DNA-binding beta-propeller fold protein YncE